MNKKTSEAQLKATRKWEENNKLKTRIGSYKRSGRTFIKNHATLEDLSEYEELIATRKKELEENEEHIK